MDYYIKCAEVIIYRNQYVLRCNKCQNLFLVLDTFVQHFDENHRRADGYVSPRSKVYINRKDKNDSFDSYQDDHDNSLIEKGHDDSTDVKVKKEQTPLIDGGSQTDNGPTVSQRPRLALNDVPAKFVVSIPKSNDSDGDYELESLSSCCSLDGAQTRANETAYGTTKKRKRRFTRRCRWHEDEKNAIYNYFGDLKNLERLPTLRQCLDAIRIYPALSKRTAPQVKTWIDNQRRYKLT